MSQKTQPIRGTKDLFGDDQLRFDYIVKTAQELGGLYCYEHLTTPIIEFTEIFSRTLGNSSDVVNKEMYSFNDRGGESITLRPEFTASICRAFISNGLDHQLPLKLFSYGPLFRYERPQKARQRQFHQLNFEALGIDSYLIDVEMIAMAAHLLRKLKIDSMVELNINSLGCIKSRLSYRTALVEYLSKYSNDLSDDSKIRLQQNPLRILDSKDENDQLIIADAPLIDNYFTKEANEFYENILNALTEKGIAYKKNPKIVRGLDYYTHTAFEFVTEELGAQGTVLAGGRYDNLIKNLGGRDTPGIGFAAGIERLSLLLPKSPTTRRPISVIPIMPEQYGYAAHLVDILRDHDFMVHFELEEDMNNKKRMKRALAKNAKAIIFIGETEIANNTVTLKELDHSRETEISNSDLIDKLSLMRDYSEL